MCCKYVSLKTTFSGNKNNYVTLKSEIHVEILGQLPPDSYPPDNCPPYNCSPWIIVPRLLLPGKLSPDNWHLDNCPLDDNTRIITLQIVAPQNIAPTLLPQIIISRKFEQTLCSTWERFFIHVLDFTNFSKVFS